MVYSDGEEGIKTKQKYPNSLSLPPFHHSTGKLAPRPWVNPKKTVVDKSPRKAAFQNKGTTKSKLKHLNKKVLSKLYESSHI